MPVDPAGELEYVTSEREAARLRLEWEHLLSSPNTSADLAAELRAGLSDLDDRWPGAEHESLIATEEELGGLGRTLRQHRQTRRRAHGVDATEAAKRRRQRDTHPSSSSGSWGRSARRVADVSGASDLASTTTDVVIAALRIGLGLALVYLLLQPKGAKGLSGALDALSAGVNLLLSPVDPLHPGKRKPPTTAGGVPVLQPGETNAHFDARMNDYLLKHPNAAAPAKPTSGAGVFGAPPLGGLPAPAGANVPFQQIPSDRQPGGHL